MPSEKKSTAGFAGEPPIGVHPLTPPAPYKPEKTDHKPDHFAKVAPEHVDPAKIVKPAAVTDTKKTPATN